MDYSKELFMIAVNLGQNQESRRMKNQKPDNHHLINGIKAADELAEKRHLAMFASVWQIPQLVTTFLAAMANRSTVLWMEFIQTLSIVLPALLLISIFYYLRKNLRFRYNYGTGKIEALTALTVEVFDIIGLLLIIVLGIRNLVRPAVANHNYLFAISMETVGLAITPVIMIRLKNAMKIRSGKISETFYLSLKKELLFGIVTMVTLIVSFFEENTIWSRYLSPIVCLVLSVPFFFIVGHHILNSARDLLDETLEEEMQLKILKILSEFYNEYTALDDVRSRRSGEQIFIDIRLKFEDGRTYGELLEISQKMENRLKEEIGSCEVNIVI